jgi:hypothetical protein
MLTGEYGGSFGLEIPVCRASARRRAWYGTAVLIAEMLLILLGGFLAVAVSMDGHNTASAVIVLAAVSLALPIRGGLDAMFSDWRTLGVCAWRPLGSAPRIRLSFMRDRYFSEWMSMNPPLPRPLEVLGEVDPELDPVVFNRKMPAFLLALTVSLIAVHHRHAVNGGRVFLPALCVGVAVAFLSFGGVFYPPLFWSISAQGKRLPLRTKIVGGVVGLAGLVCGLLLAISYRGWPR